MKYSIIQANAIDWLKAYDGPPFHAAFFDPPYHLTSITQRYSKDGSKPARGGVYNRSAVGFMQKVWDSDIVFQPGTWELIASVLYPGAFTMAYCSSRGWHRQAVAMEDGGFIFHPSIFMYGMAFGSGFPKATRVKNAPEFEGHRYGTQALKPALEPILVGQKPYEGRPVDCITQTGAGVLNIDRGRIEADWDTDLNKRGLNVGFTQEGHNRDSTFNASKRTEYDTSKGRWPSNLVLHCHCSGDEHEPNCAVRIVGEQSGESGPNGSKTGNEPSSPMSTVYQGGLNRQPWQAYNDSGTAARYFYQADWSYEVYEQLNNADLLQYITKPTAGEREAGLGNLPDRTRNRANSGGYEADPKFAPQQRKNHHPTIKSISLNKHLASLLLPPKEYVPRRIFVPFCGVGSEIIGCLLAGWDEVIGIELEPDYYEICQERVAWWSSVMAEVSYDVDNIIAVWKQEQAAKENSQLSLLEAVSD